MQTVQQLIEKNLPSPVPELPSDSFDAVELTDVEVQQALEMARRAKGNALRIQANKEAYEQKLRQAAQPVNCTAEQLHAWILQTAPERFAGFKLDEWNKALLIKLSLYFSGDQRAVSDHGMNLSKGILLVGTRTGQGKTWLMKLFNQNPVCSYRVVSCLDVATDYQRHPDSGGGPASLDYYAGQSGPMYNNPFRHTQGGFCFDDMGVEPVAKCMGNECNTMMSILQLRYNNLHRTDLPLGFRTTHVTTNLTADQIESLYDSRIRSRMREMFNLVEVPTQTPDRRA